MNDRHQDIGLEQAVKYQARMFWFLVDVHSLMTSRKETSQSFFRPAAPVLWFLCHEQLAK